MILQHFFYFFRTSSSPPGVSCDFTGKLCLWSHAVPAGTVAIYRTVHVFCIGGKIRNHLLCNSLLGFLKK